MKPVWSLLINLSNTPLILLAIAPDAILYTVSTSVKGLQFLNCLGVFSFGMQVMIPWHWQIESSPLLYPEFSDLRTNVQFASKKP